MRKLKVIKTPVLGKVVSIKNFKPFYVKENNKFVPRTKGWFFRECNYNIIMFIELTELISGSSLSAGKERKLMINTSKIHSIFPRESEGTTVVLKTGTVYVKEAYDKVRELINPNEDYMSKTQLLQEELTKQQAVWAEE